MGADRLTVEVRRGPSTARASKRLAHPHPVDTELLRELRALGPVMQRGGRDAVGVDAPAADERRVVGDRAQVLTGDDRRRADPHPERDAEALVAVNSLLGMAGGVSALGATLSGSASTGVFVREEDSALISYEARAVTDPAAFAELGALRRAGATRAQILRVVAGETLLAVGVGAVLGAAVTAVNLAGLGAALASLSAPVTITVPWRTAALALGACALVAVVSTLPPAWRATRA
jgi:putative ABC transport system permease protein